MGPLRIFHESMSEFQFRFDQSIKKPIEILLPKRCPMIMEVGRVQESIVAEVGIISEHDVFSSQFSHKIFLFSTHNFFLLNRPTIYLIPICFHEYE